MRHSARAGVTLVEWTVVIVALGVVFSLLVPAFARASRQGKVVSCRANLQELYRTQAALPKGAPAPLGKAFWTRLDAKPFLRCPLAAGSAPTGCDYLGPASDPAGLGEKEPLGCDDMENHGPQGREGGNVLLKSGEVMTDSFQLWASATRGGKCRP